MFFQKIFLKVLWNLLRNFLQEFFQYFSFCNLFLDSSRCPPLLLGIHVKALRRFHQEFLLKFIKESSYYSIKLRVLQGIVDKFHLGFLTELVIELELINKFAPELLQSSLEILQDFLQGIFPELLLGILNIELSSKGAQVSWEPFMKLFLGILQEFLLGALLEFILKIFQVFE